MSDEKRVYCDGCGQPYVLADNIRTRAVSGHKGVTEFYLHCPYCTEDVHSYFMSEELAGELAKVQSAKSRFEESKVSSDPERADKAWVSYLTARDAYGRKFTRLNNRLRRKFGML